MSMNLKEMRINAGMTAREIALIAGVTRQAVSQWETGETRPAPASAKKVADHFGVKVTDIWPIEIAA